MNLRIRNALTTDEPEILDVMDSAFGAVQGREIGQLVSSLLRDETALPVVSLVAEVDGRLAGHVLISCARIEGSCGEVPAAILGPLAVAPEHQGMGIGGSLIRGGLEESRIAGCDLVFVLGHPGYYVRHGFIAAGANGFEAPYAIADEHADAWMVQELQPGTLGSVRGRVTCADSLMDPKHWRE